MTRQLLVLSLLAAASFAAAACAPSAKPPIEYNVREYTVAGPLREVYGRLRSRMLGCPSANSLLSPPEVVSTLARDRRSGRVAMVSRSSAGDEVLWGANLVADGEGTKLSIFTARFRGFGNRDWLIKSWAEGRDPERLQDGFDFVIC